jgi:hypothetical protein
MSPMKMDNMLNPKRMQKRKAPINGAYFPTILLLDTFLDSSRFYFKSFTYFASALACSSVMLEMGVV